MAHHKHADGYFIIDAARKSLTEAHENVRFWQSKKLQATTPTARAQAAARVLAWQSTVQARTKKLADLKAS
jgi:hypothetical protein